MKKIINTALRAWIIILVLVSNSASAQNLDWRGVSDLSVTGQGAFNPQIALSADGTKATAV